MEQISFSVSVDERFALLSALLNRRDLVDQIILSLDSVHDSRLIELYRLELSHLISILKKLGYYEENIAIP